MSKLTPNYLAILRDAVGALHEDGMLVTESHGDGYIVTSQLYPLDSDTGVDVRWLCYTDTLGGAETIRTLLGSVRRLLDEVDRLRAEQVNLREVAAVRREALDAAWLAILRVRDVPFTTRDLQCIITGLFQQIEETP